MEFKGLKINIIILVIIIVIISYFAGQHLLKIYNVDKPLQEELLEVEGVADSVLIENNGRTDLMVSFESGIDFFQLYNEIEEISREQLGKNFGKIRIQNKGNQKLEDVFYQMHFAIYEGIATNKFTSMESKLERIAEENNLNNYKLWIDDNAVYLQMADDEDYLYRRIKRIGKILSIKAEGGENSG